MKKIESSITIERSPEEVFAAVTDFARLPVWRSGLLDAAITSEGPIQAGSTYRYNLEVMGRKIETTGQVEAYEQPKFYAWKATSGPFPLAGSTACEAVGDGTRVTEVIEVEPGGFFKLAEPLLVKQQQEQMEKDLTQLKELLENGG